MCGTQATMAHLSDVGCAPRWLPTYLRRSLRLSEKGGSEEKYPGGRSRPTQSAEQPAAPLASARHMVRTEGAFAIRRPRVRG